MACISSLRRTFRRFREVFWHWSPCTFF